MTPPSAVLDTNTVLDWLVFRDPATDELARRIETGLLAPGCRPARGPLACTDPDDQVFIDFALQHRCTWLVSRDRALLRLARRAAAWGVEVLTPQAWMARTAP